MSLLRDALTEAAGRRGRIGAELGHETQIRMPLLDYLRVEQAIAPTEPPSIHPNDATVLEPGMVITIEPGMAYDSGGTRRVMVHEENIVITERQPELLTMRVAGHARDRRRGAKMTGMRFRRDRMQALDPLAAPRDLPAAGTRAASG